MIRPMMPGDVWQRGAEFRKIVSTSVAKGVVSKKDDPQPPDVIMEVQWTQFESSVVHKSNWEQWCAWAEGAIQRVPEPQPAMLQFKAALVYDPEAQADGAKWMLFGADGMSPQQAVEALRDSDEFEGKLIGIVVGECPIPPVHEPVTVKANLEK